MKKFLSIVMAVVMLMAMAVTVSADEVILSEDFMFFDASNWAQMDAETTVADLMAALETPGCYLVITRSAPCTVVNHPDGYEKFCLTDSWWGLRVPNDEGEEINTIRLGTANHLSANAAANDVSFDCTLDDGLKVWYDGAALLELMNASNMGGNGPNLVVISNTSSTEYQITNMSVVVPAEPIVVEEETPAVEEEPAVEETPAVEDTPAVEETTEEEPADTGLALAVVPMIVAAAAVVLSKKR